MDWDPSGDGDGQDGEVNEYADIGEQEVRCHKIDSERRSRAVRTPFST